MIQNTRHNLTCEEVKASVLRVLVNDREMKFALTQRSFCHEMFSTVGPTLLGVVAPDFASSAYTSGYR